MLSYIVNNQSWQKKEERKKENHIPIFFRSSQCLHMSIFLSSFPLSFPCSIISYFKRRMHNFICISATRHKTINQISIIVPCISHSLLHLHSTKLYNCSSRLRQSILYKSIIVISNFINFVIVMSLNRIWIFESPRIILSDHRGFVHLFIESQINWSKLIHETHTRKNHRTR